MKQATPQLKQPFCRIVGYFPRGAWLLNFFRARPILLSGSIALTVTLMSAVGLAEALSAPASAERLMAIFAQSDGVRASFLETRQLSVLARPIETSGRLYFAPPDQLARITTSPVASQVIADGSQVMIQDNAGTRTLSLSGNEVAKSLIGGISLLLDGNIEALHRLYKTSYRKEGSHWTLSMIPKSKVVRSIVKEIRATGQGDQLTEMRTTETNGDITTLQLSSIETGISLEEIHRDLSSSIQESNNTP